MSVVMSFTKIALKNLFSKPVTTSYPFTEKTYPERTRGHVELDPEPCILCGMCSRVCPPGAIKVDRPNGEWSINGFDCIQCGYCTEKCPKKCLSIVPGYTEPGNEKSSISYKVEVPPPPAKPAAKPAAKPVEKAEATKDVAEKKDAE